MLRRGAISRRLRDGRLNYRLAHSRRAGPALVAPAATSMKA